MPQRLNTIIVVPHSKAKFFKFSFSSRALALAACGGALALFLSIFAIAYTGSAVSHRAEVKRLQAENRELVDVNRRLETTISEVQARLDEFEERTSRLALAAGGGKSLQSVRDILPCAGRLFPRYAKVALD